MTKVKKMKRKFLVETSARHIHLTQEHLEILCGQGSTLQEVRPLSQPGQYVSNVRLTLVGPKKSFDNVVVLGPVRKGSQVEVSATEARMLGVKPPVRESGDTRGSASIILKGPVGEVVLEEGCIIAKRHIHMTTKDAAYYEVKDKQIVAVKVNSQDRSLIFGDVVIRVRDDFALSMHIDTDESNAAGLQGDAEGELLLTL
jgi:putative phosphotransacetylase